MPLIRHFILILLLLLPLLRHIIILFHYAITPDAIIDYYDYYIDIAIIDDTPFRH
jgi:hypothetical protein